jgi:SAM-dependent methyltransferase
MLGIDPLKPVYLVRGLPAYLADYRALKLQRGADADFPWGKAFPCIADRYAQSGSARGHYFHQDLLVARRIHENAPVDHVDVGSRIDGFVAHVAAFRPIQVVDVRPLNDTVPNIRFLQADLMNPLPPAMHGITDSLSCLHALEHFGLGRYGDPIRYEGHLLGLDNLHRIVKSGGKLYLSVPIGPQRIEFNAHRVFSVAYMLGLVEGKFSLDRFSYVDDLGDLHENVPVTAEGARSSFGCAYGCGIFELTKR